MFKIKPSALYFSLSLSLVACQTPISQMAEPPSRFPKTQFEKKEHLPVFKPYAQVVSQDSFEQLTVEMHFPKRSPLTSQWADPSQLAYITVSLRGQEIEGTLHQDGKTYLPISGENIKAKLSNIPLNPGHLRVVTVQGYDANFNPLGAFEASGYYYSQSKVVKISLALGRRQQLLGRILNQILDNAPLLKKLDLPDLQALLEQVNGYDAATGEFLRDPSLFDSVALANLLPTTGSPLPSVETILAEALASTQDIEIRVETPNGKELGEDVRLILNDPISESQFLPYLTPSGENYTFANVPTGQWQLQAFNEAGELLNQTSVTVNESGFSLTSDPFVLTGVQEYIGELHLNASYTTFVQSQSQVQFDSEGNYIVVWTDGGYYDHENGRDGSGRGIYGQRFDANGFPLWTGFQANSTTSNHQVHPDLAVNASGDYVVVWQSLGQDGDGYGIYAQRFDETGIPQGTEFQVSQSTVGNQELPVVEMDKNGNFVVAWTGPDTNERGVYARLFNADGEAVGSEFSVNTHTSLDQYRPAIAMDRDGDFVLTWQSLYQDNDNHGVFAQRYNAEGAPQGSEFRVNQVGAGSQRDSDVAMDEGGNFVVVWAAFEENAGYGIFGRRYNANGVAQGNELHINTYTTNNQAVPAVAMDADGDFVVLWESYRQDYDVANEHGVYGQRYNPTGIAQGQEFRLPTYLPASQNQISIDILANGSWISTWSGGNPGVDNIGIIGKLVNAQGRVR